MLQNVYTSLSGALAQEKVMDIIANNLANVNTVGFKGESVAFSLLEPEPYKNYADPLPPANYKVSLEDLMPFHGNEMSYVGTSTVEKDFSQGSAMQTKNPFDLMIEGKGFFAVNTKEGIRYTRNGAFTLNEDGALVDKIGNPILGEKGNIFIRGTKVEINPLGEVYQNGEFLDKLVIHDFEDPKQLEKVGSNYFLYEGPGEKISSVKFPTVRQGYLESSNVNAIKNLTNMILAHRSFEAYQKSIKSYDSLLERSNNKIAEVRG